MVERAGISAKEAEQRYRKWGVVVLIQDGDGNLLTLWENEEKADTRRQAGEISVVCETAQLGENWKDTTIRGLQEELGIDSDTVGEVFVVNPNDCLVGEMEFVEGVLARVVRVTCMDPKALEGRMAGVDEVSFRGWESRDGLLGQQHLRTGVRNVLAGCSALGVWDNPSNDGHVSLSLQNLRGVTINS